MLIGTAVSLYFVPWLLVKAWVLPLPDNVQEQLDQAIDHGFKGVIVYVDQKGRAPAFYTSGWHDPAKKIPARPDALFKIASVSKLYTAVAITKMVHAGRLSLDETLAQYFPELAGRIENAERITVRTMVQHRSGIPNFTDVPPDYWAAPKATYEEKLALVLDLPANFAPDEDYEYSNTNYLLLRELLDRTLGYHHFQFIQSEVLDPLGLNHTYASVNEVPMDDVMSGYHLGYDLDLKTDDIGMLATAEDVGKFVRALNDGAVFEEREQEIYNSIYKNGHKGWVPGYQSIAQYDQDLDAVVVLFTSPTDPKLYHWNLADIVYGRILKIMERNSTE